MRMLVSWSGKGKIIDRLKGIFDRSKNLGPITQDVKQLLLDANRERALKGIDSDGLPYAPLRPSTIAERRRLGFPASPPLNRNGTQAAIIVGCEIQVYSDSGTLRLAKSWPTVPWIDFAVQGTSRMPARNPMGFSPDELARARTLLKGHVLVGRR